MQGLLCDEKGLQDRNHGAGDLEEKGGSSVDLRLATSAGVFVLLS